MGQAFDDVVNAAAADPQKFWGSCGPRCELDKATNADSR